jgi:hypothetical protein
MHAAYTHVNIVFIGFYHNSFLMFIKFTENDLHKFECLTEPCGPRIPGMLKKFQAHACLIVVAVA